jgi:hypothetical protein
LPVPGEEGEAPAAGAAPPAGDEAPPPEAQSPEAEVPAGGGETPAPPPAEGEPAGGGRIPAHLLERSRKRKEAAGGGAAAGGAEGGGGARVPAAAAAATAVAPAPTATGPGGHTQRLLTVVKAGSIQQTRADPVDKVHVWPHLLVMEFTAILGLMALVTIFSALVRAPLLELANFNRTPNPSKAPWYFLGLQELLTMFHPMVAGVTIPGVALGLLAVAPYIDKNPSQKPADRKFAISIFTLFMMFWAVLVIIGSFFRGQGFNFVFPWESGLFFDL